MTLRLHAFLLLPLLGGAVGASAAEAAPGPGTSALRAAVAEAALRTRADQGDPGAQYQLGVALAQGRGGPADPVEAFVWLTLAAEGGRAGPALDGLFARLTGEQIAEARRRLEDRRSRRPNAPMVAPREAPLPEPRPPLLAPPLPETAATSAAERTALRAEIDQLRATLSQQSRELAARRVEAEAARLAARQAADRPSHPPDETLRTELAAERTAREVLEARLTDLQRELADLRSTETGLRGDLAEARAAQADADQKLASLSQTYVQLEVSRDQLAARLNSQHKPSPQPTADADTHRRLAQAEQMIADLQADNARLRERAEQTNNRSNPSANQLLANSDAAASPAPQPPAYPASRTHVVTTGDTLSGIALRYYGNANKWREIFAANRDVIRDERSLATGRTLRIPSLSN